METKQKIAITVFLVGLAALCWFGGEMLSNHSTWNYFATPPGVGEVLKLGFSIVVAIAGALGINIVDLIRNVTGKQDQRKDDTK